MTAHNSGSAIGAGGPRAGMTQTSRFQPPMVNQLEASPLARTADLPEMLRLAVIHVAKQLLLDVHHAKRTESESQFLSDCARGRRAASEDTLSRLLIIQGRTDSGYAISEAFRAIEIRTAPIAPPCPLESSRLEEATNGPLNIAQQLAHEERTPTRWQAVVEYGTKQLHATRRLIDDATRFARLPA